MTDSNNDDFDREVELDSILNTTYAKKKFLKVPLSKIFKKGATYNLDKEKIKKIAKIVVSVGSILFILYFIYTIYRYETQEIHSDRMFAVKHPIDITTASEDNNKVFSTGIITTKARQRLLSKDIYVQDKFDKETPVEPVHSKAPRHSSQPNTPSTRTSKKSVQEDVKASSSERDYSSKPTYFKSAKKRVSIIPITTKLRARLIQPIENSNTKVFAKITSDYKTISLKGATIIGRITSIENKDNRIIVDFHTININGESHSINASAYQGNKEGLNAFIDSKTVNNIFKYTASTLKDVTALASNSVTYGLSGKVLDTTVGDNIDKIETDASVKVNVTDFQLFLENDLVLGK